MNWYALYVTALIIIFLAIALVIVGTFTGYIEWYLPYTTWKQNVRRQYTQGRRFTRQMKDREILLRAMELINDRDHQGGFTWARVGGDDEETVEILC
jgi:hypothetical protein